MNKLQKAFYEIVRLIKPFTEQERDIEHFQVIQQIYEKLERNYPYCWIAYDMVDPSGSSYVVFSTEGKLYRVYYSFSNNEVNIEEPSQVEITFSETERTKLRIFRDSSNNLKFLGIAASSVLNRVNEIDSRELFDDFEKQFESNEKPILSFYHASELETLTWGIVDGVSRFGNLLIFWGSIDEKSLIGRNIENINEKLEVGFSIGYQPTEEPNVVRISDFPIKVYNRGYLVEVSLLLEEHAANYFTEFLDITRGYEMARSKDQLAKLLKGFLGEEAEKEIEEALADAETRNRSIENNGLITREEEKTEEAVNSEATEEDKDDIVVDETIQGLIDAAIEKHVEALRTNQDEKFRSLQEKIAEFTEKFEAVLNERLAALEKEDDEKIKQQIDDLPEAKRTRRLLYRPTETKVEENNNNGKVSLRKVAKENLKGAK